MRTEAGSSLIESVVALAVLAVGSACHGIWMMQSVATHARASRIVAATTIAVSLELRIRANRGDVADLRSFHTALLRNLGAAASGHAGCTASRACTIVIGWQGRDMLVWTFMP